MYGFAQNKLNIKYRCEECEDCKHAQITNATECNKGGDLVCGGCVCYEDYQGNVNFCFENVVWLLGYDLFSITTPIYLV